ncbi:MAG TPA: DUF4062 domain-containing protein [Pyrinomonadaceae bacterium]|nr:DUF4062 domain-containing protein [Pyrinomonadaceae bacterium]
MRGDKRYQIFISSTFEDLRDQRKQAIEVIFERGHIPIALERFSPANDSDLEVIKRVIADCQVYLLILGHRYGEMVPERNISFTELEYELAEANGLLILPFVLKQEEVTELRSKLNPKADKERAELANYERLEKFHQRIRRFRKLWGRDDQFKYLVATALSDNLDKCEKPGFVREPEEPTAALLASASENEFVVDIVGQLKQFKKLYDRCLHQPEKKRELARFFREQYLDRIARHKASLFFESGSTVAFVARELAETLSKVVRLDEAGRPNMQISTNNILVYLQLWLKAGVACTTFPWSPPKEENYGATFGTLEQIEAIEPDYDLRPPDDIAKEEIKRLKEMPYTLTAMKRPSLILGAASGLQIGERHKLKLSGELSPEGEEELSSQVGGCFGPHVGSYHNKVFKRFIYETKVPLMIFLTADKIDCEIEVGRCHFVLDSELKWDEFYRKNPVAFCVGCTQDEMKRYTERFESLGFEIHLGHRSSPITAFIARNSEFIMKFEQVTPIYS